MTGRTLAVLAWRSVVQARYLLLGCIGLLTGLQVVIVGQASAIEEAHSFSRMADLVPAFLQRGLGGKSLLLATFKGTVAFGYFHPLVIIVTATIAVYFATEPAHEIEAGLVDLTLARVVPRHHVVTRALLLAVGAVAIVVTLMGLGTWFGLRVFASPGFVAPSPGTAALLLVHLAAVAVCFGGFGLAVAAWAKRWTTAFTTGALAVLLLYLVDFLAIGWPAMRSIAWISPVHYYPALDIVAGDPLHLGNLGILLAAATALSGAAYWRFARRDL
jgi:ABC-type transport system involved in multi-copper enzyme maturation permease subunit